MMAAEGRVLPDQPPNYLILLISQSQDNDSLYPQRVPSSPAYRAVETRIMVSDLAISSLSLCLQINFRNSGWLRAVRIPSETGWRPKRRRRRALDWPVSSRPLIRGART